MAKKDKKSKEAKKARLAEKKEKATKKSEQKNKKLIKKQGDDEFEDDVDIDELLSNLAKEQALFEAIHVENVSRPTKRMNASLISNNNGGRKELILFGGETTNGALAHFYNDLYVYSIDNDSWKKITSKNSPLPRSSHTMCNHPSGVILLFGGEFSSPKQSTFYHYGDTWILDSQSKEWTKVDQKKGPLLRSGHRMTYWKNYIIMHGGFRDLGTTTTYLSDVWLFDITSYKWIEVTFPPNHVVPDSRSGHSLIPSQDGAILWGGYTKVKAGKGLQKGKVLTDCWNLKMKSDPTAIRWERRRKQGFQPSPRVGCSMSYHKGRGLLFGGVYDYDESEENLESIFYNSLFAFNAETNRWYNQTLRATKKKASAGSSGPKRDKSSNKELEELLNSILAKANIEDRDEDLLEINGLNIADEEEEEEEKKVFEIRNQLPHERFNAATTVIDDVLYIYGGVWESGEQEFNLDSLYAVDLGKLDGCKVLWEDLSELDQLKEFSDDESDDDDEDDDDEDDDEPTDRKLISEEEEEEEEEVVEDEPEIPDLRPWLPHPKLFESLRNFYLRTGGEFLEWAISQNRDARGAKLLKSLLFDLCEDRWWERRDQVRIAEDSMEELGNVSEVIEKDTSKPQQKRR